MPTYSPDRALSRAGGRYLDGTLGMGGHASAVLSSASDIELCGLDRDEDALNFARHRLAPFGPRAHLFHCRYSDFADALGELGWSKVGGEDLDVICKAEPELVLQARQP